MATFLLIVLGLILILAVVKPLVFVGLLILMGLLVYALFWPICAVSALLIAGAFVRGKRTSAGVFPGTTTETAQPPAHLERARIRPYHDDTQGPHGN